MDFRQIEAFAQVVKLKSFSKAADAVFLTQPTISAHISSLENELGIKLIDRSSKDVIPTKAGKLFYDYAVNMINIRDNAIFKLNEYSEKMAGKIEVCASTVPCQYIMPELIKGFIGKYPNVTFSLDQMDTRMVTEKILQKESELGFVGSMIESDKLSYHHFMDDKLVLITPNNKKYSSIDSDTIDFKAISDESFVLREAGSGTRQEFEKAFKKAGFNPKSLKAATIMNSTEAVKQAVSLGMGISIVSAISVEDYVKFGLIKAYNLEGVSLARAFYLVHHKSVPLSPLSLAFLNYALEQKE